MLGSKVMYLLLLLQALVLNPGCASERSLEIIKNAKSKVLLQKCRIRILRVGACHVYGRRGTGDFQGREIILPQIVVRAATSLEGESGIWRGRKLPLLLFI